MTAYIWLSEQSEPGLNGKSYAVTRDTAPPDAIEPTPHFNPDTGEASGLAYDESFYGDWRMVATADAVIVKNHDGEDLLEIQHGAYKGSIMSPEEVLTMGLCRKVVI